MKHSTEQLHSFMLPQLVSYETCSVQGAAEGGTVAAAQAAWTEFDFSPPETAPLPELLSKYYAFASHSVQTWVTQAESSLQLRANVAVAGSLTSLQQQQQFFAAQQQLLQRQQHQGGGYSSGWDQQGLKRRGGPTASSMAPPFPKRPAVSPDQKPCWRWDKRQQICHRAKEEKTQCNFLHPPGGPAGPDGRRIWPEQRAPNPSSHTQTSRAAVCRRGELQTSLASISHLQSTNST